MPESPARNDGEESTEVWGFRDTAFRVNERGHIEVTGTRYPGLSGNELPLLLPWFERVTGVRLTSRDRNEPRYPPRVEPPRPAPAMLVALREAVGPEHVSDDPEVRIRRGHGHAQAEVYAVKHGGLPRVPDYVVSPGDEAQVLAVVQLAAQHGACVIPFGGGTNVTQALECPPDEARVIVSLDTRRLDRVLWIDPVNRMACVQAGARGRHIAALLAEHGFTMGHEPDSIEFSTLGGWIATNASGMKKNRYGNIEDIVLDMTVVTADGVLSRATVAPRESTGIDPRQWIFGSEGNLGVVTSAVVKLFPLPEEQAYGSVLFESFERGVAFMYDLAHSGRAPASVRLVDNTQFQLGMALKPARTGLGAVKSALQKTLVTRVLGFDPDRMVGCTLVFEGTRAEVAEQRERVARIARRHGGVKGDSENGRRGYMLTFGIAYIRDCMLDQWFLGESFETSVPWSQAVDLCARVKRRLADECARREIPARPFVSSRVTQIYETGCAVYFYFAIYYKGIEDPSGVFHEIEAAARDEVLRAGGSLSHHHGVGKLRRAFLPRVHSPTGLRWINAAKRALDPNDVFGAANLPAGADTEEALDGHARGAS